MPRKNAAHGRSVPENAAKQARRCQLDAPKLLQHRTLAAKS
jgi:hypothetical protein